jgi:hypothetical protein
MINVARSICEWPDCTKLKQPAIDGKGYCIMHAREKGLTIQRKSGLCAADNCIKTASKNIDGLPAKYCGDHSIEGMINTTTQRCCGIIVGVPCIKYRRYHLLGLKAAFCKNCKSRDMVDVACKYCTTIGCNSEATYGIACQSHTKCKQHKEQNMLKNSKKRCNFLNCLRVATHGIDDNVHCVSHLEDKDRDLTLRKCTNCPEIDTCDKAGLCISFCSAIKVHEQIKKYERKKENAVHVLLQSRIKQELYSFNKTFDTSCNRKRPDFVYDADTHFVIIDCDEYMHLSYDKQCELDRMRLITQALGISTINIRYNPDSFKSKFGKNLIKLVEKKFSLNGSRKHS